MSQNPYQTFHDEPDDEPDTKVTGLPPGNGQIQAPGPVPTPVYSGQPVPTPGDPAQVAFAGQPVASGQVPVAPGQVQLAPAVARIPGCPPGLEYLAGLTQVLVHQQIEIAEILININFENRYLIKNSLGQQIFFAREESECCMRTFCGAKRGFIMHLTDNMGQEVMTIHREFKCCAGCCWCADQDCCAYYIAVESPPGSVIGYVRQTKSKWTPQFDILNANEECVLKIRGPWHCCQAICCTDDVEFKLMTNNLEMQIGNVSKQWGGWVREAFTKADNFGVSFPVDLDVKLKATALAATFLIDFMFFETNRNRRR